jgi:hypothetical protein
MVSYSGRRSRRPERTNILNDGTSLMLQAASRAVSSGVSAVVPLSDHSDAERINCKKFRHLLAGRAGPPSARPCSSDLRVLCDLQGVVHLDAEVTNGAVMDCRRMAAKSWLSRAANPPQAACERRAAPPARAAPG